MRKSTQNLSRKTPGEPRIITRIVQGHNRGPKNAKMPLGSYNHGFRVANTPTGEASGELTLLTKVGRRHERDGRKEGREAKGEQVSGELTLLLKVGRRDERDGRKEGREAKGGTVGRAIMVLLIILSSDLLF